MAMGLFSLGLLKKSSSKKSKKSASQSEAKAALDLVSLECIRQTIIHSFSVVGTAPPVLHDVAGAGTENADELWKAELEKLAETRKHYLEDGKHLGAIVAEWHYRVGSRALKEYVAQDTLEKVSHEEPGTSTSCL